MAYFATALSNVAFKKFNSFGPNARLLLMEGTMTSRPLSLARCVSSTLLVKTFDAVSDEPESKTNAPLTPPFGASA